MEGPYREIWRMITHLRKSGIQADVGALLQMARDQGLSVNMEPMREIVRQYELTVHCLPDELAS